MSRDASMLDLVELYGGAFRLTAIVQKRMAELARGARPLVETGRGRKDMMDIVLRELSEGRIEPAEGVSGTGPSPKEIFSSPSTDDDVEE